MSSGRLYLLGCDTGDGIDLEGSDVRAGRARLCAHDNGVVIEPVGEAPVALNGRTHHRRHPRRLQSLEGRRAVIKIDEWQAFQAAKRDLEAELRGW